MAAIRSAIVARLVVDGGFVVFDMRSFTPRELPGMNSLIDAILLAILARVHAHPFWVSRSPVVNRRIIAAVDPGVVLMRDLIRRPPEMLLVHRGAFPCVRKGTDAALAIEAGVVVLSGVNEGAILVYAVEAGANVPRCCVVKEVSTFPAPTPETNAAVPEAVINPTVESDVRSPVARMPAVSAAHESPVAGRPKQTGIRRRNPRSRNPVVAHRGTVAPVAGCPKKSFGGAGRLLIYRQRRRRLGDRNTDCNLCVRFSGYGEE